MPTDYSSVFGLRSCRILIEEIESFLAWLITLLFKLVSFGSYFLQIISENYGGFSNFICNGDKISSFLLSPESEIGLDISG